MTITTFDKEIDGRIVERGRLIHRSGGVEELAGDGGAWTAQVEGTDLYDVSVSLGPGGRVVEAFCDCPYDYGPYCKHQAAVLFAIRDELSASPARQRKAAKKESIEAILERADPSELISFLLDYAREDRAFADLVRFHFGETGDTADSARKVIAASIRAVRRNGYVEYDRAAAATEGAHKVLGRAEGGDPLSATRLCIVVLEEMIALIGYCDDSEGEVGAPIAGAIERIVRAAGEAREGQIPELFDMILSHCASPLYDGWEDWRFDLLRACLPLCADRDLRDTLRAYMTSQANEADGGFSGDYTRKRIAALQLDLLLAYDGEQAAEAFLMANLDVEDFRERAVRAALAREDYAGASALCLEGEARAEGARWPGLVSKWRGYRYDALTGMDDTEARRALARQIMLDGNMSFWEKLRGLYPKAEWEALREELYAEFMKWKRWNGYEAAIVAENAQDRILAWALDHPERMARLYPHLSEPMREELVVPFAEYIRQVARQSASRREYEDVAVLVGHFAQACGLSIAEFLRDELMAEHPRRRAMHEVLMVYDLSIPPR